MKTIIAIDPGASGGFCQFIGDKAIHAWKFTSLSDFVDELFEINADPDLTLELVLEDVPPFAGKNIPSSTGFKLGKSCGFYEGVARGLRIPCHMVRPQTWQKGFGSERAEYKRKEAHPQGPCFPFVSAVRETDHARHGRCSPNRTLSYNN